MPDYKDSKIYKITCNVSGLTYYGSTTQSISKRMGQHRSDFKKNRGVCTSKLVLAGGNYDYCLVEKCPCDDKSELHRRERFYIETNECVNSLIPGRTPKENIEYQKEYQKEYRAENKEISIEYQKEYRAENKERSIEYQKKYRAENIEYQKKYKAKNKEKNIEYQKKYKAENIDKLKSKACVKITCECGCIIRKSCIARHKKTQKHITLMSKFEQQHKNKIDPALR
jgi:hypothetical protein